MRDPLAPTAPIERIRTHLVSLRMPRALEALDQVVQQLERGEATAIEAIETLLAEELTIRESLCIKAALQIARLTPIKSKRYGEDGAVFELTIGAAADPAAKPPGW